MERATHINIAMIEDTGTNGTARSKVVTALDQNKQRRGSTVSFHNIQYKVQLQSGFFCKRKTSPREILVDLKSVAKLSTICLLFLLCLCQLYLSLYFLNFLRFLITKMPPLLQKNTSDIEIHRFLNCGTVLFSLHIALLTQSPVKKSIKLLMIWGFFSDCCLFIQIINYFLRARD